MAGERLFRLVLTLAVVGLLWVFCGFLVFLVIGDSTNAFIVGALIAGVLAALLNWRLKK